MKKIVLGCCGLAALVVGIVSLPVAAEPQGAVGVEALMKNVDQHKGSVRVEGVVSAASAERQSLTLIDTRELEECGVTTCAQLKLPVRWTGTMPAVRAIVRVDGEVQRQPDGKLVFVARGVEQVRAPQETR